MLKKIKDVICEIACRILGIVPCMCNHQCGCKKKAKK
jgi:hypothetical protein